MPGCATLALARSRQCYPTSLRPPLLLHTTTVIVVASIRIINIVRIFIISKNIVIITIVILVLVKGLRGFVKV